MDCGEINEKVMGREGGNEVEGFLGGGVPLWSWFECSGQWKERHASEIDYHHRKTVLV
jgi:hypothetical protein